MMDTVFFAVNLVGVAWCAGLSQSGIDVKDRVWWFFAMVICAASAALRIS